MTNIFSVLSDETLEKIAAGGDLYKSMTDSELEAVAAIEAQQPPQQPVNPVSPIDPSTSSAMLPTIETIIASLGENNPPTEMGSDTIGGIDENPAIDQFSPNVVGGAIGEVQTLVTPEEAKAMPEMGAATKGALRVEAQGGPTAYEDDGSVVNWLGNLWNTIAYNSSGKVTAKSTNKHTQAILRGTVNKDGREVPLTQLDDDELDYLVDSAGWNGWKGWLGSFVGNRADDGIMQQWDRTTGATIQDPIARKAARVKHAQDIARGMIQQQESEKLAAGVELENRPKQFGADVGAGFVETASYMLPYLIPHTRGIMAGIIEAGDRTNELLNDVYYVDDNGTIRVKAQRDSTGTALAKGAARGAIAPLVERFGGEMGAGMLGAIAKNTLGRIPLIKAVSGKVVETTAGKAVSKWMNSMSRLGKYTGMQSMPVEMLEEFEDQVLDAGLGLNLREGEKRGTTALSRAAGAVKEFFKPENLRELAESMILIQVLGGGVAAMNDRRITKHLDSLIAKEAGITPEELSNYSLEDKQAAYQAFVEGLSEAEIARRFNRGAEAINKLANTIRDGNYWKDNLDSFKEEALASMDEPAPTPDAESPKAYASEGDLLSAEEAQVQEQARAEWVPAVKSNEVAPGAVIELPDGTKLRRNIRGVAKWQLVGGAKNAIALADSAAEKLMADGFRVVTDASARGKNNKGVITNETGANEASAQSEQTPRVTPPAGEEARPVEAGKTPTKMGGTIDGDPNADYPIRTIIERADGSRYIREEGNVTTVSGASVPKWREFGETGAARNGGKGRTAEQSHVFDGGGKVITYPTSTPTVEAPTSAPTETQVNTPPTTTESAERNFDAADYAVDVLPTTDDDLPPSDDSESEILPSFENPEEKDSEEGLVEEELDVLPTTELPPDPKPTTTNRLKTAAGIDPTAVPTKKTKVDKLLTFPDSLEKYGEMTGRLLRTLDKGGVFPDSPKGKSIKAELARMDEAGWGEVYKAQMRWAGSPKDTRGEQPPRTPAEFTEWKKAKESAQTSENGSLNAPVETATTTPLEPTTSVEPLQQAPTKEDAIPNEPEDKSREEVPVEEPLNIRNIVNFDPTNESHVKDLIRTLPNVLKRSSKGYSEYDSKLREFVERFNEQFKKFGYLAEVPKLKVPANPDAYILLGDFGQRVEMVESPALFKINGSQKILMNKGTVRTSTDAQSSYAGNFILAETGLLQELITNDAKTMTLDAWLKKWNPVKERIRVNEDRYNKDREKSLAPLPYSALLGSVDKESILKKYGISDTHNFDNTTSNDVVDPEPLPKPKLGRNKKTETEKLEALTKRNIAKAKAVFDYLKANNPNATLDPYKFRYSQANTNGLKLDVLRNIVDIATVDDFIEQGLTNEQAEELFNALTVAYQEQSRRGSNSSEKASNDSKVSYAHGAMLAIDKLRNHPDDLKFLANAMKRVSDAFEFSRRRQDSAVGDMELAEAYEDFNFWQSKHNELQAKFNALSESDREKVVRMRSGIESKRDEADNQNEVSLNAGGDGGNIDIADSNAQTPGGEGGATTTMTGKGSVGTGGSLAGNRHIRIDKVDGDNLTATMVDAAGKKIGTKNMTRAQWEVFAKATLDNDVEIDPKNPQVGDMIRLSNQVNTESQEERDRRFAEDKNYQAWLKRQNANDADKMRERYEQESAKIAAGIGRNFIGGMKVKVVDREYIPGVDGNAGKRQSIIGTRGLHILGKDSVVKRAQKMLDEGASRLEVWQKTGVYRGKEGKYRYELPFGYNEASLVMQAVENIIANKNDGNAKGTATLGEAVDFLKQISETNPKEVKPSYVKNIEKLFEAYPWFRNITINTFAALRRGVDGQYNIKNKTIDIGERAHHNFDEAGVFLHELQHAIQLAEGFSQGTDSVVSEDYHTRAGEVEARLAAYRATLTEKQRKSTPPWEMYDVAEKDQTLASWEQVEKSFNGDERLSVSFRNDNIRVDHKWTDGVLQFDTPELSPVTPDEDAAYMDAVRRGDMETAERMVREAADARLDEFNRLNSDENEQGFKYHRGPAPKETRTMYAVFNVGSDGFRAAYAGNANVTPVGVWLDAQNLRAFTSATSFDDTGKPLAYIPGDTGASWKSKGLNEREVTEAGVKGKGFLLQRGGKHGTTVPNFAQMNTKQNEAGEKVSSAKDGALPHNKLVFEIEVGIGENGDLTDYVRKNGRMVAGKNQGLAEIRPNQFYKFKTNPNANGEWGIAGTFRIKRLVPYDEIVRKTEEANAAIREHNANLANGEKPIREFGVQKWVGGYRPEDFGLSVESVDELYQTGQKKKLLDAVTYDDAGNVIPLSQRFNPEKDDIRYLRDPKTQKVVGTWNRKTNELTLFRGANASTLVHELGGHAAYQFAQEQAAQGDKTLLNKMNECINYALTNPKMKPLIEDIRSRYPEASEEVMRDEIFAALMERNSPIMQGLTKTLQGKAWYNRTWQAIKDAFRAMLAKMGFNKADLRGIDKMQPEEFMSWLDRTMADGKRLGTLKTNISQGVDGYGIMTSVKTERKDNNNEFYAQRDRISEQGNSDGMGGESKIGEGSRRLLSEASAIGRGVEGRVSESTRVRDKEAESQARLVDYAKANGVWDDNVEQTLDERYGTGEGQKNTDGGEAVVWFDRKRGVTVKAIGLDYYGSPTLALERIELHNKYFPDTELSLIGFGEIPDITNGNGEVELYGRPFNLVVEQPLIDAAQELTKKEIRSRLEAQGFKFIADRGDAGLDMETPDGKAIVSDLHERNVFGKPNGALRVIDCDIRYKQGAKRDSGDSGIRKATTTTTATSFMDDKRSRGEKLEEKFVDSTAPIKSVQKEIDNHARANGEEGVEEVVNADGSTDWRNSTDFVAAKDKENGHLERNIRELKTRYIDPAMEALAKAIRPNQDKADLITDFNLYLQCKHAAARNRKIANDRGDTYTADYSEGMGMVTLPDGRRVGLSENVANQLLATMERKYGAKFNNFDDAAQSVYKMLEADLYNRYQSGLLSAEDYIKYMERRTGVMDWGTYVPLKDDLQNTEAEAYKAVSFSPALKRNEFMKAKGRGENDIADSPFAAAVLQAEQGIRRSSRNVLANVEANLAAKMNGGFAKNGMTDFSVTELTSQGQPAYAEVVAGVDVRRTGTEFEFTFADGDRAIASAGASVVANRPDIHLFKRDGKLYAIRYPAGANGRGIAVANAFSGENMGNWGKGMSWVPRVTHWLSSMRTQYSPEFTVSNMLSDNLEALQALVGRYGLWDGGKAFGKALKYQWKNRKDLWHYVKTGEARGLVKNAIDAGILTKGGVVSQGIDAETKELTADLDKFIRKQKRISEMNAADMAKSFGRNVVDYISMANSFAEYSTRIGIASALEEYGVPRKDAIKFARDATVNFNRKGTAMPYINGLYMFANAAVQGAMRSVQSFQDDFSNAAKPPKGQLGHNKHKGELVGMLVVIGVAKAILDNALGDDDEREKEGGRNAQNLSEYDRKHNVGLPIGGGRQIVPLRFRGPYAAIPYLAQTFTRYAMGDIDAGDVGAILASELGSQTTELIGGNGVTNDKGEYDTSLFMQSIAPTLVDPFVQMGTGKDYKGDNRLRKKFDNTMPDSSNGKRNTPGLYKGIAQVLNYITGGNENRIGKFDAAPENVQLLVEFIGGAPLRDINNVMSSVKNAAQYASGGTPEKPLSQIPFVRRFVREYPDVTGRYYDAIEMYERDKAEYKKATRLEERRELRKDKPYLSASNTNLDKLIERVKELTHLERGEVKRGRKWVEPKVERSEQQKEHYRKQRLKLQATILRRLGE